MIRVSLEEQALDELNAIVKKYDERMDVVNILSIKEPNKPPWLFDRYAIERNVSSLIDIIINPYKKIVRRKGISSLKYDSTVKEVTKEIRKWERHFRSLRIALKL